MLLPKIFLWAWTFAPGLLYLFGTVTAGVVTSRLGVVTVLNLQAAGYVFAGLLALALLPRESKLASSQEESAPAESLPAHLEGAFYLASPNICETGPDIYGK